MNHRGKKDQNISEKSRIEEGASFRAQLAEDLRYSASNVPIIKPESAVFRENGPMKPSAKDKPWLIKEIKGLTDLLILSEQPVSFPDHQALLADAKTQKERTAIAHEIVCKAIEELERALETQIRLLTGDAGFARFLAECAGTGKGFWGTEDAIDKIMETLREIQENREPLPEKLEQAITKSMEADIEIMRAHWTYRSTALDSLSEIED